MVSVALLDPAYNNDKKKVFLKWLYAQLLLIVINLLRLCKSCGGAKSVVGTSQVISLLHVKINSFLGCGIRNMMYLNHFKLYI